MTINERFSIDELNSKIDSINKSQNNTRAPYKNIKLIIDLLGDFIDINKSELNHKDICRLYDLRNSMSRFLSSANIEDALKECVDLEKEND